MAKRIILGVNQQTINRLHNLRWFVHVEFYDEDLYNQAVSLGFNKEIWEKNNFGNKVLIKRIFDKFESYKHTRMNYFKNN